MYGWDGEWNGKSFRNAQGELKFRLIETPGQIATSILNALKNKSTKKPGKFILLGHDRNHAKSAGQSQKLNELIRLLKSPPHNATFHTLADY